MDNEKREKTNVLLISLPGVMQNILRHTLMDRQDIKVLGVASGCLSAFSMIKFHEPDLVVIDSNMPESEVQELIQKTRAEQLKSCFLVLTETNGQKEFAKKAGADFVLRSDSLSRDLDVVVTEIRR